MKEIFQRIQFRGGSCPYPIYMPRRRSWRGI